MEARSEIVENGQQVVPPLVGSRRAGSARVLLYGVKRFETPGPVASAPFDICLFSVVCGHIYHLNESTES